MTQQLERQPEEADAQLTLARRLVDSLEAGDHAGAQAIIDEITAIRETELFRELGNLTRELHEALKSFHLDPRLGDIALTEIPDARTRLNHVIDMTEQAAHRTLTAIETSLPLVDEISRRSRELGVEWGRFRRRELSAEQFRALSRRIGDHLDLVAGHGSALQEALSDALMAQGYQDLTGQIIRRVISLVQEVEKGLVELMRVSGRRMAADSPAPADSGESDGRRVQGPAIEGHDQGVVHGQDEVDDLLSSLGF